MEITIRQAGPDDLETLLQWRMEVIREVFSLPAEMDTEALARANRAYYQAALRDGSHIACFALCRGEIVGCGGLCLYQEIPSPDNPSGRCGYLVNIYDRPAFRQHGTGRRIVQWLVRQAIRHSASKIYLETSEAGRALYRDLGFTAMKDQMLLPTEKAQAIAAQTGAEDQHGISEE